MVGVELETEGGKIVIECLKRGLLINCTQGKVLRFLPPLIIDKKDIDTTISVLSGIL